MRESGHSATFTQSQTKKVEKSTSLVTQNILKNGAMLLVEVGGAVDLDKRVKGQGLHREGGARAGSPGIAVVDLAGRLEVIE